MPTLTLEEVVVAEPKKKRDLTEGKRKPVICVLDPNKLHQPTLEHILAGLLDKIEISWHSQFSRTSIGMGGIDDNIGPASIAFKRPALIISELEVVPDEPYYGLEMLGNIRLVQLLKPVPLMVISGGELLEKIKKESRINPHGLRAKCGFAWNDLRVDSSFAWSDLVSPVNQAELFDIVSEIIGFKSRPGAAA